jgi:hypothetical protein
MADHTTIDNQPSPAIDVAQLVNIPEEAAWR